MEEQDVDNEKAATHGTYENAVAHVDNDSVDADPDWSETGPATRAGRVGQLPKRGRGRPRIHLRRGDTNSGRSTRTQPQAQKEPKAFDQPSEEKKTVTPCFELRKTRATAKKEDLVIQETIRTSTEPESRHGSRALSAGADQETVYLKTGLDLRASGPDPEKSRPDYAVQPSQDLETTAKLPGQEMGGRKKTERNGTATESNVSNMNQGHTQGFIQAPEPLIYPNGFGNWEQQAALSQYGEDVLSEFRGIWRKILASIDTDSQSQTRAVDVWKSLLDPNLATKFRAPLSARYRELTNRCKQKDGARNG
ncbi:hypothetical protein QR685DRAFT_27462 [Neurospora intermedia]|uniref:Uncharacterized protein n=1 Tax=Neurospora intermedia TaxID=5142 RepID=A0ABR3DQH0_NEUIN